jgi:hypothetical protein
MTMVLSYVWRDKIVMMADSRISRFDSKGIFEYFDNRVKIHPAENLVIGNSGLGKAIVSGKVLEVEKVIAEFIDQNKDRFPFLQGKIIVEGLVQKWNATLEHSLGINPADHPASFMFARWENGYNPKIYSCESTRGTAAWTSFGGIIGDEANGPIVAPYFKEDLLYELRRNHRAFQTSIFRSYGKCSDSRWRNHDICFRS